MRHAFHEEKEEKKAAPRVIDSASSDATAELKVLQRDAKIKTKLYVPLIAQSNGYDCGPTTLNALLMHYEPGMDRTTGLGALCKTTRKYGTFPEDMVAAAESLGFKVDAYQGATVADLMRKKDEGSPAIVLCTFHYLPVPDSIEIPTRLWYAWQDTLRHATSLSRGLEKAFRPFEDVHYLVLVDYDEKNLVFADVSKGLERRIPKDEFEKRWFGKIDKKRQDTLYRRWMMTVSKEDGR